MVKTQPGLRVTHSVPQEEHTFSSTRCEKHLVLQDEHTSSTTGTHLQGNVMDCPGIGVVRHGSYYVQVAGGGTQQVAAQVAKGNQGITKETERLPHQVEDALVLLPLLQRTVGETGGEKGRPELRRVRPEEIQGGEEVRRDKGREERGG